MIFLKDYQPGWTLVGGGIKPADAMKAPQESLIPKGVEWIKTNAAVFDPENNSVTLKSGKNVYIFKMFLFY